MGTIKQNLANNIETSGKFDAKDLTGTIPANNITGDSIASLTIPSTASGGDLIQTVASDPPAPSFGDVWYNSTEQKIKLLGLTTGTWATGGNLPVSYITGITGAGTQNAAFSAGGELGAPTYATLDTSQNYNGTSWTASGTLTQARRTYGAAGTQTAGLIFGGTYSAFLSSSDQYNGSSWTAGGTMATARQTLGNAGTQTAALAFGGTATGPVGSDATEEYDGASWTTGGNLPTAIPSMKGAGLQTSAMGIGPTATTVEYNGTSWATSPGSLNTPRGGGAAAGTSSSSALYFGSTGGATESYDGTSWTTLPATMSVVRSDLGGLGTQTLAIGFGSGSPGNTTEEWTGPAPVTKTIQGS